jgi:hypothetical protein
MTQNIEHSRAELLSDTAVYRRTVHGRHEMGRQGQLGRDSAARVLALVDGYTDLRRLVDLAPDDASSIGRSILELMERGFIECVRV